MIAPAGRGEAAIAGWAGAAIRGDPVAEGLAAALETATALAGVIPDVFPFAVDELSHGASLSLIPR